MVAIKSSFSLLITILTLFILSQGQITLKSKSEQCISNFECSSTCCLSESCQDRAFCEDNAKFIMLKAITANCIILLFLGLFICYRIRKSRAHALKVKSRLKIIEMDEYEVKL